MVDFKDPKNKLAFLDFKKTTIDEINTFIDDMCNEENENKNYKKAVNLTYWIKDYKNYLKSEKTFKSTYLPTYPYGKIVEINLGFKIGAEHGGLHYGVVINKKDNKSNPILTIIPLKSSKDKVEKDIHRTEVYLGDEFYNLFSTKIETLKSENIDLQKEFDTEIKVLEKEINNLQKYTVIDSLKKAKIDNIQNRLLQLSAKNKKIELKLKELDNCGNKILKLKTGSIALVSQVTTISKLRIKDPLKLSDPLGKIVLSQSTMDNIENKFNKLFF